MPEEKRELPDQRSDREPSFERRGGPDASERGRLRQALAELETAREHAEEGERALGPGGSSPDSEDRAEAFLQVARDRGVRAAVAALRNREADPFVIDVVHDRLARMIEDGEIELA